MCQFFSFDTKGGGKPYYFNAEQRVSMPIEGGPDSHTTIATYYFKKTDSDDRVNKYEYSSGVFKVDQINVADDREQAKEWITEFAKTKEFEEICLEAIKQDGYVLRHVKK